MRKRDTASAAQKVERRDVVLAVAEADEDLVVANAEPLHQREVADRRHVHAGRGFLDAERPVDEGVDVAQLRERLEEAVAVVRDAAALRRQRRDVRDPRPPARAAGPRLRFELLPGRRCARGDIAPGVDRIALRLPQLLEERRIRQCPSQCGGDRPGILRVEASLRHTDELNE